MADLVPHERETPQRRFVPAKAMARAMAELPEMDARERARDVASADELFGPDTVEDPWRRAGHGTAGTGPTRPS
jgi:hypothetical protein